ncbi:MAG: hypothetical protein NTU79_13030 [Planctomycetota bacterium]|nr:hypothetical protein [Planctomycetota bacterium]
MGVLNTGRDTALQWNWVSRGLMLKLVAIGLSSLMLSIIGALALVEPQALLTSSVGYTLGAGFFAALTFDFTGRLLCSVAPVTSPTRATIAGSIGCQLAAIIVFVTALLPISEQELPARILLGIVLAGCAHALAAVFFVVFACNVAAYLGRDDLALSPILVLFLFGGTSAMYMTIVVILVVLLSCPCIWFLFIWPLTRPVPILFLGLLYFGPLYCYGRLLLQLRRAVNQRVRELT